MPDTWNKPRLDTRDFSTPIYPTAPQQSEGSTSQTSNTGATAVGATNFVDQASNNFNQPHINQTNIEGRNIASAANADSLADIANKQQPIDARDSSTPIQPTAPSQPANPVNQPNNATVKGAVASPEVAAPVLSEPLTNGLKFTANEFLIGGFLPEEMQAIDEIIIDDTIDFTYKNAVDKLISIHKLNPNIKFKINCAMLNQQSVKQIVKVLGKLPEITHMSIAGNFHMDYNFRISGNIAKLEIFGNVTLEYTEEFDKYLSDGPSSNWKHINEMVIHGNLNASEHIYTDITNRIKAIKCSGIVTLLSFPSTVGKDNKTLVDSLPQDTKVNHVYGGVNTAEEYQAFFQGCKYRLNYALSPKDKEGIIPSTEVLKALAGTIEGSDRYQGEAQLIIATKIYVNLFQAFMLELLNTRKQGADVFIKKFRIASVLGWDYRDAFMRWKAPKDIDKSNNFSGEDIKKLSPQGKWTYKGKNNFNYYYNSLREAFEPIAQKILDTANKMDIESNSKIRTVTSRILGGLRNASRSNYLLMLTDPEIFNQTDKSWM